MYDLIAHLATKRDLDELARKTESGFDQLVTASAASLKLMLKEISSLRKRIERLERRAQTRR